GRSDKASVAAFLNKRIGSEDPLWVLKPNEILEFKWVDLAGDGRCELVMMLSYGPDVSVLEIDWKDQAQVLTGVASLKDGIRDLDGDGKKEIILYSYLDLAGRRADATPMWPQVYRLKGEEYIPASKDFHEFYDLEILPELDKEIAKPTHLEPTTDELFVAALEMQRDKILRVLGRDPNAGLEKARRWTKSDNPVMIDNAVVVLSDIGGHEEEARAAEEARRPAFLHWVANHPYN